MFLFFYSLSNRFLFLPLFKHKSTFTWYVYILFIDRHDENILTLFDKCDFIKCIKFYLFVSMYLCSSASPSAQNFVHASPLPVFRFVDFRLASS